MSKYPYLGVNDLDQSRHAQPCSKKQKATQTVQKPHTLLFTPCIIFTFKSHQQFLHCFAIFLFILFCQSLFLLCFFFLRSILAVSSHFVVFLLLFFFLLEPWKESSVHPKAPWSTQSYSTLHTYILCKHGRHLHLISRNLLFPWCSFFSILPPSTLFSAGLPNTHTHTHRLLLVLRRKQQLKSDHSSSLCYKFPFSCLILPSFTEKLLKYYSPCPFHTIFSFMFILLNRHQQ